VRNLKIEIEKFLPKMVKLIEGQFFVVGVLDAAEHKSAQTQFESKGLKSFHGLQARKVTNLIDGATQEIGGELEDQYKWLREPFADGNEKQKEIQDFAKNYIAEIQKDKKNENRLVNLVQAIVRNPILRRDYGSNSEKTQKIKGFDSPMIDTGQFFNSIKARVIKNV
jgi:hypothetical protein